MQGSKNSKINRPLQNRYIELNFGEGNALPLAASGFCPYSCFHHIPFFCFCLLFDIYRQNLTRFDRKMYSIKSHLFCKSDTQPAIPHMTRKFLSAVSIFPTASLSAQRIWRSPRPGSAPSKRTACAFQSNRCKPFTKEKPSISGEIDGFSFVKALHSAIVGSWDAARTPLPFCQVFTASVTDVQEIIKLCSPIARMTGPAPPAPLYGAWYSCPEYSAGGNRAPYPGLARPGCSSPAPRGL